MDEITPLILLIVSSLLIRQTLVFANQGWAKSYSQTISFLLLPIITYVITKTISGNIALSLGMIGALSIVRFRTPIKEPEDLVYLFLSIGLGIGFGAYQVLSTLIIFFIIIAFIWLKKSSFDDVGGSVKGSQGVIKKSFDDPRYALKTTIAQASLTTNDLGETILEDRYNFNEKNWKDRTFSIEGVKTFLGDMKNAFSQPEYGIPRTIGSYLGSGPGEGSMVKINLGKLTY